MNHIACHARIYLDRNEHIGHVNGKLEKIRYNLTIEATSAIQLPDVDDMLFQIAEISFRAFPKAHGVIL